VYIDKNDVKIVRFSSLSNKAKSGTFFRADIMPIFEKCDLVRKTEQCDRNKSIFFTENVKNIDSICGLGLF